jgi:hypothetical protein
MASPAGARRTTVPDNWIVAAAALVIILTASLPYWLAYHVPAGHVFTGILVNPADGNSYFAKLREGWAGAWAFTLPYTADPGPGAFIFTYFLALGHVARWLNISLDVVYQAARMLGGLALLLTAWAFVGHFAPSRRARAAMWLVFALGSGLGWLVVPLGGFTSDLWVAEAFPFLALFSNAHFALALALELWILRWALPGLPPATTAWHGCMWLALATTVLAQVQPMVLISAGLVIAGVVAWRAVADQNLRPLLAPPVLIFGLLSVPWLAYDFALTMQHPVLAAWNAQNLTPSPPLWDTAVAGGVPLLLAAIGLVRAARRRAPLDVILIVWLGLGGMALYAPFALQRRLSIGLWLPVAVLAVQALRDVVWPRLAGCWRPLALALLAVLALPSNLLVYAATLGGVMTRDPAVFWTADEAAALGWLDAHAASTDIVVASPAMALFIPARSAARVLYGHPFETTHAAAQAQLITDFYAGRSDADAFAQVNGVRWVLVGPRERALMAEAWTVDWPVAFASGEVVIYAP